MTVKNISLSKETIEEIKQNIERLEKGDVVMEQRTVKSGNYKAVLPLDDLEIEKGEIIYLFHCGKGIWLMIPKKVIKQ